MRKLGSVEVEWIDSAGQSRWHPLKEAKNTAPLTIKTLGYLIAKDRKRVVIVGSIDNKDAPDVSDALVIPRGCVKTIRLLK